jgi:hypothetical protein
MSHSQVLHGGNRSRGRLGKLLAAVVSVAVVASTAVASAADLEATPVKNDPRINEGTPAADGPWFMWGQNSKAAPRRYNVYAQRGTQRPIRLNARGTVGNSGGIDGRTAVYTQWSPRTGDDLFAFDLVTKRRTKLPPKVNGRYHEFRPTISGKWVLFTRYNWDRDQLQVVLFNRRTRAVRVLATERGRRGVWAGQVSGSYATWDRWSGQNSDVFRYEIRTRTTARIPRPVFAHQFGGSVASDGTVYYTRSGNGCGNSAELARYPLGGPAERVHDHPSWSEGGDSYVDERAEGGRVVYFGRIDCRRPATRAWDVYKVVDSYTITVAKSGSGGGTVASTPTGIACGTDCEETFARGVAVTLTATPDEGSEVTGWSRQACASNTTCTIKVVGNEAVTVTFEPLAPE